MMRRIPAQFLSAGDVVGSGETVIAVSRGVRTPAGKVEVGLRRENGSTRLALWGARTEIGVRRLDPGIEQAVADFEASKAVED